MPPASTVDSMGQQLHALIQQRPRGRAPTRAEIERWLGVTLHLEPTRRSRPYEQYRVSLPGTPFATADIRLIPAHQRALAVLDASAEPVLAEATIELDPYGTPHQVHITPEIPPEGTVGYEYRLGDENVTLSFTARSRRLASLSFAWGER